MGNTRGRTRARRNGVALALILVAWGLAAPLASSGASAATNTYLLFVGHGVGVVATMNESTDCGAVYLTTDFSHWRDVTPRLAQNAPSGSRTCLYVWTDASFTSPTDGWLTARNAGSTQTILRHTVNGGRTWTVEPGGDTGSNGGGETIGFVNGSVGFRQQFGYGSNGNYALQRTVDGGVTWSTRSPDPRGACQLAGDVFSSATVGLATESWSAGATNPTRLWRTVDGGVTWSTITLAPPPSLPRDAVGLYGAPTFDGPSGALPVDYLVGGRQEVYLFVTGDGGLTWAVQRSGVLPIAVSGALAIDRRTVGAACTPTTPVVLGREAVVSSAGPTTWWVLRPGPRGATTRTVVSPRADVVSTYVMKGLPPTTGQVQLGALDANDALITFPLPYGFRTTYETANGGVTWTKVAIPAQPSNVAPNCASSQLTVTLGRSGAAMGHVGVSFDVRNRGSHACRLEGFPTVQMIGAKGPIPTIVTFGTDYTVPSFTPAPVLIGAGREAAFLLGYAAGPGYGMSTCPKSTSLRVTPPGDRAPLSVRVGMQPFGGSTIATLVCGEVAVSPIVTLAAASS